MVRKLHSLITERESPIYHPFRSSGVQITDAAIVAAATLAHRYLTSRKLPDSAIDLIDEACAAVHVARDSLPEEVDQLQRQKLQLEIELQAIRTEISRNKKDESAKAKLQEVSEAIARIDDQLAPILVSFSFLQDCSVNTP